MAALLFHVTVKLSLEKNGESQIVGKPSALLPFAVHAAIAGWGGPPPRGAPCASGVGRAGEAPSPPVAPGRRPEKKKEKVGSDGYW